jgi:Holliday junction resolvase RusA-like endonuclease
MRRGGAYTGRVIVTEKSKKVAPWRDAVSKAAADMLRSPGGESQHAEGPLNVEIIFMLPRPASHYRRGAHSDQLRDDAPPYPSTRPDIDKLIRSTLDGLTASGLIHDDGQIVALTTVKRYATGLPGAAITIYNRE